MKNDLIHYGVMGMKWGVRKDGKPQGFQYGTGNSTVNYTKYGESGRKTGKALIKSTMGQDKSSWRFDTKSPEYQEMYNKSMDYYNKNLKNLPKAEQKAVLSANMKFLKNLDNITIDQAKSTAEVTNKIANQIYNSKKLQSLSDEINSTTDRQKRQQLTSEYSSELQKIGDKFTDEYREAVVKDIGYDNIELGKLTMNEIGYGPNVNAIYEAMMYTDIADVNEAFDNTSGMGMKWGTRR